MYNYRFLSLQPMLSPRYEYCKARNKKKFFAGTPDGKPDHDGRILIYFNLNDINYGPYSTGLFCFRSDWDGRKRDRKPEASRKLEETLGQYTAQLREVHRRMVDELALKEEGTLLDGETLMAAMRRENERQKKQAEDLLRAKGFGHMVSRYGIQELYQDFITSRKADVEEDRKKRQPGQIAESTLSGYPKRWAMVEAYLQGRSKKKDKNPLVRSVEIDFIEGESGLLAFLKTHSQKNGQPYAISTINKCISMLKQMFSFAVRKKHIKANPFTEVSCRGASPINPKPLTEEQVQHLEAMHLPDKLRHICDSWLLAGELCLHHSDYMRLPTMNFIEHEGKWYIQNDRTKQRGDRLIQTVDITERAQRILTRYGGPENLYYASSGTFSDNLKRISIRAHLVNAEGEPISIQFGMGRDTGLTSRGIRGANDIQLTRLGGWSSTRPARRYMGLDVRIVHGFASGEVTPDNS